MSKGSNKNSLVVHTRAQIRIALWYKEERTYGNAGKEKTGQPPGPFDALQVPYTTRCVLAVYLLP